MYGVIAPHGRDQLKDAVTVPACRHEARGHHGEDLREPLPVVGDECPQSTVQVGEAVLVGGKDQVGVEPPESVERLQEVGQRVGIRLRVPRHIRADPRQHAVAGEE